MHENSIRGKSLFAEKSNRDRLISDRLTEIAVAASMRGLEHAGFVFDKHQLDFETLDSKIA